MNEEFNALAEAVEKLINAVYIDWPNSPEVRKKVLEAAQNAADALVDCKLAPTEPIEPLTALEAWIAAQKIKGE